jgi:triacylglycerol lipase
MPGVVKKIDTHKEIWRQKSADEFAFKSSVIQPLNTLGIVEQSLFLAEASLISYLTPQECNRAAGKLGFQLGKYFEHDGSQAYWYQNEHDSVLAFRGTEAHEWNDIKADANALTAVAETVGKVHRGFKREADDLWPVLEQHLETNSKPLWFTGHSLGGAIATICASRCLVSRIKSEPAGLFTFGSPRVGDRQYINHANIAHFRWVNNNDVVPRVPPFWLGYSHGGRELYLDRYGKLKNLSGWRRLSDRLQGLFAEFKSKFRIDYLSDHSIMDYIDHIAALHQAGVVIDQHAVSKR